MSTKIGGQVAQQAQDVQKAFRIHRDLYVCVLRHFITGGKLLLFDVRKAMKLAIRRPLKTYHLLPIVKRQCYNIRINH